MAFVFTHFYCCFISFIWAFASNTSAQYLITQRRRQYLRRYNYVKFLHIQTSDNFQIFYSMHFCFVLIFFSSQMYYITRSSLCYSLKANAFFPFGICLQIDDTIKKHFAIELNRSNLSVYLVVCSKRNIFHSLYIIYFTFIGCL